MIMGKRGLWRAGSASPKPREWMGVLGGEGGILVSQEVGKGMLH